MLNSAVKAPGVGVSEGKEEALISLARPNPLAFDRAQISSKTKSRLRGQMKSLYAGYQDVRTGGEEFVFTVSRFAAD